MQRPVGPGGAATHDAGATRQTLGPVRVVAVVTGPTRLARVGERRLVGAVVHAMSERTFERLNRTCEARTTQLEKDAIMYCYVLAIQ